ncbi:MAG TPA: EthD domain-containing protein [Solirubrobacteraceae bacterium]|jgi:hypothetical protein
MGERLKAIYVARFREDMTREAGGRYWTDVHAPMADALDGMVGYVQSHVVGPVAGGEDSAEAIGFDGFACEWWRDRPTFEAGMSSEAWAVIVADGPEFLETASLGGMSGVVSERVLVDGPPGPYKLAYFVRFREGMDIGEAEAGWLAVGGPLGADQRGLVRHIQNLVVGSLGAGGVIGSQRAGFDGLAELWFEDGAAARECEAALAGGALERLEFLEPWPGASMCARVGERVIIEP